MKSVQLYGWKDNFGDALNYWLWPRLLPGCTDGDDALLLGIGTVLSRDVPDQPRRKVVLGAGVGNDPLPRVTEAWTFLGVRGPWTAARLGLPEELVVSDPALLVRSQVGTIDSKKHRVSFMPHVISAGSEEWAGIAGDIDFNYIDPRHPVDDVLRQIRETELLITEAMHGAIVADAFRVPWIRVQGGDRHAPTSKWLDWTQSLGIDHESYRIPFLWRRETSELGSRRAKLSRTAARARLKWIRRVGRPRLSSTARSNQAYERLLERTEVLRKWLVSD